MVISWHLDIQGCPLLDQVVGEDGVVVVDRVVVVGQGEMLGLQMLGRGVKMSENF